jgi:hypothetical protein
MVPFLQDHFTVSTYDRRGRGQSGDTPPFTIHKELEGQAHFVETQIIAPILTEFFLGS